MPNSSQTALQVIQEAHTIIIAEAHTALAASMQKPEHTLVKKFNHEYRQSIERLRAPTEKSKKLQSDNYNTAIQNALTVYHHTLHTKARLILNNYLHQFTQDVQKILKTPSLNAYEKKQIVSFHTQNPITINAETFRKTKEWLEATTAPQPRVSPSPAEYIPKKRKAPESVVEAPSRKPKLSVLMPQLSSSTNSTESLIDSPEFFMDCFEEGNRTPLLFNDRTGSIHDLRQTISNPILPQLQPLTLDGDSSAYHLRK